MFMIDSPKADSTTTAVFSKFLPYNSLDDSDDSDCDPYSSDQFRIYEFKVRKCSRTRTHDWTDCPFAHPGEKARRRDPKKFHYSGTICSEYRKNNNSCTKGDDCEFSHGVFECWLHPTRYRTQACKDGKSCKRKVCFFAHSTRQLRNCVAVDSSPSNYHDHIHPNLNLNLNSPHCCGLICCHSEDSPTSTLMCMSSPKVDFSRYGDHWFSSSSNGGGMMRYKDGLTEVMLASLEAMKVNEINQNPSWMTDVNYLNAINHDEQQPPNSTPINLNEFSSGMRRNLKFNINEALMFSNKRDDINLVENPNSGGPDFGWVNDLLT